MVKKKSSTVKKKKNCLVSCETYSKRPKSCEPSRRMNEPEESQKLNVKEEEKDRKNEDTVKMESQD